MTVRNGIKSYRQFVETCSQYNSLATDHDMQLMDVLTLSLLHEHASVGECIYLNRFNTL